MSERDVKRIEVLSEVLSGRRTVATAASLLGVSERQAYRLLARYQASGGFGLVHKACGRTSNRSHNPGVRKFAVELVKTHYADFGPTLATEALAERHAINVGRCPRVRCRADPGELLGLRTDARDRGAV